MNTLSPFGWLYGVGAELRNVLYDRGILSSSSLCGRTISIGNITVGGTGKTPLVALAARLLSDSGERVCVLTRGYRRRRPAERVLVSDGRQVLVDAKTGGDEPVELGHKLIGEAAVVADRDRVAAANWARRELGCTAFVLDDGFQHRRAERDLDIVCIDATNPFGNGEMLPAGVLREKQAALARADVIVLTRTDLVHEVTNIEREINRTAGNTTIFRSSNQISRITKLSEFLRFENESSEYSIDELNGVPAFAFCGLANPINFFRQIELNGFDIKSRKAFPDHHVYDRDQVRVIEKKAVSAGCEVLLTTAKDAVKLQGLRFGSPCFVVEIETIVERFDEFRDLIVSS